MKNCLNFRCDFTITDNPLNLNIDDYLEIGVRKNKKRRFLFISKQLGKHLACRPSEMDELGKKLALVYNNNIMDKYVEPEESDFNTRNFNNVNSGTIISFAETSTALGHSFFDNIVGDYEFIHTTREKIDSIDRIEFLEEHSHATEQNLYSEGLERFSEVKNIILIDDEITTANTCMNIIKQIESISHKDSYTICSILNWVDEESMDRVKYIEREFGCEINFVYLFKGRFEFEIDDCELSAITDEVESELAVTEEIESEQEIQYGEVNSDAKEGKLQKEMILPFKKDLAGRDLELEFVNLDLDEYIGDRNYVKYTGRFGMDRKDQIRLKEIIRRENSKLNISADKKTRKILFLGTEEFMYIPMMFAKENEEAADIYYYSTTRSPIIAIDEICYPIRTKQQINSLYNSDVVNYIYNLELNEFTESYLFVELHGKKEELDEIISVFKSSNIDKLTVVYCS
ncbi:MAG: phosphoribosyltransferase family protein [Clostridioides sp.]|jgi:hypothetical protein|nr:phosphoribosyltransferase family protein [Clostridioides sp.]